MFLIEIDNFYF